MVAQREQNLGQCQSTGYIHTVSNGMCFLSEYGQMSDEQVAILAKNNPAAMDYLLEKYKPLVKAKARNYYLPGAEREDVLQEGMIGLFKSVRTFRIERGSFHRFAGLCIERNIVSAVKRATRLKQNVLNQYVSLVTTKDEREFDLEEVVEEEPTERYQEDPEQIAVNQNLYLRLEHLLPGTLSELEVNVLTQYLLGKSYSEISSDLNCKIKSIDNALSRIRRKLPQLAPEIIG